MPLLLPWLLLAQPAVASVCTDNQIAALTCTSPARSGRLEVIQGGGQFTYVTPNEFERYTCNGQQIGVVEDGPEHIYRFTCAHDTQVTAQVSGLACDADLFVLEPCAAGTCTVASVHPGRANEQLTFACHPGHEYWVTVEAPSLGLPFVPFCPGFIPLGSPQTVRLHYVTDYTLTTSCAEDCGNAIDDDEDGLVDCADPGCSGQPACCDRDGDRANATGGCGGADCNDNDATIFPNAPEIVDDGVDQDCDGRDGCYQDRDLDGWGSAVVVPGALTGCGAPSVSAVGGDCLDVGAGADQIHPGAPDPVADGLDQDCDGVDTCWVDLDGDGWGSTTGPGGNLTCTGVDGFAPQGGDCMDGGVGSALVHPGAFEVCNGLDDDCDGLSDDDDNAAGGRLWYRDVDGDGYGVPSPTVIACAPPPGYAATSDDCDDLGVDGASIHPDAEDTPANGRDEDCDGRDACYVDVDLDGFGGPIAAPGDNLVCGDALGEAVDSSDCLDQGPGSAAVHPGGVEVCNGLDDDCDGLTDDDDPDHVGGSPWWIDADGDGFPGDGAQVIACAPPPGGGAAPTDCDDAADAVYPAAEEVPADGIDQDCDGRDDCWIDLDLDGFGGGDHAPSDAAACGLTPGESAEGTDCVDEGDGAALISPAAPELCDGSDNDCDQRVDDDDPDRQGAPMWYFDLDGDGYPGDAYAVVACVQPEGGSPTLLDCRDAGPDAATTYPGAAEIPLDDRDQDCDGVDDCLLDLDLDGYGSTAVGPGDDLVCGNAPGEARAADDCLDVGADAPFIHPGAEEVCNGVDDDCDLLVDDDDPGRLGGALWYLDGDGDGFPGGVLTITRCAAPPGGSLVATDCLDAGPAAATTYPGADEREADGVDQDCDGVDACPADLDGDGFGGPLTAAGDDLLCGNAPGEGIAHDDCQDVGRGAADVYPGAPEVCNGVDDDCDLLVDAEDPGVSGGAATYYFDLDGDGFAGDAQSVVGCTPPPGGRVVADDCRDAGPRAAEVYPGAPEVVGDGLDQDCDGVDACWIDRDGDGFGGVLPAPGDDLVCGNAPDEAAIGGDCLDGGPLGPSVWPGAPEVCDGVDDDCDGLVDDADDVVVGAPTWYLDSDGDGFAGSIIGAHQCAPPSGQAAAPLDCDDGSAAIHPGAPEVCNTIDDDCDTLVDGDDTLAEPVMGWQDVDLDGWGDASRPRPLPGCDAVPGIAIEAGDCDDRDPTTAPGLPEVPYDALDQDCDGADLDDQDHDGWTGGPRGDDCADLNPSVHPEASERADGVDEDCDGVVDEGTRWYDDDGDGATDEGGDCDDADAAVRPGATEVCDGRDDDCDGFVDDGTPCVDDDGDGYSEEEGDCDDASAQVSPGGRDVPGSGVDGDCDGVLTTADVDGDGYGVAGGDCDDALATTHPGAEEQVNGVDDDCDGAVDEGTVVRDDDFDGYSELAGDCDDTAPRINPSAAEIPDNGRDDDCDGTVDEGGLQFDDDGDGYAEAGGDCNDANPEISPVGVEVADGVDQDCDGQIDDGTSDLDGDGYAIADGDCDDDDGWVHPAAAEVCDLRDNDCDDTIDEGCEVDAPDTPTPVEETDDGCACGGGGHGAAWTLALAAAAARRRRAAACPG